MLIQDIRSRCVRWPGRPLFTRCDRADARRWASAPTPPCSARSRAVLLRPLPYPDPERLVRLFTTDLGQTRLAGSTSPPDFVDWRRDSPVVPTAGGHQHERVRAHRQGVAEQVAGSEVTGAFFDVMGVRALHGRTLVPDDDTYGGPPVAVLGYGLWLRRFGGDPAVVGRHGRAGGPAVAGRGSDAERLRVPPGFGAVAAAAVLGGAARDAEGRPLPRRGGASRAGRPVEAARAEMKGISARLAKAFPRRTGTRARRSSRCATPWSATCGWPCWC